MPRWNFETLTSNQDEFDFAKFKRLLVAYAKENTALVTSFLSTPFTQIIGVDEDTSIINAISSVGGLLGLFMGFTMVTLAEIIYYSSSLLITSILGINNQVKNYKTHFVHLQGGGNGKEREETVRQHWC